METALPLTLHLLGALGLYLLAVSTGAWLAPERWRAMGEDIERSPALTIVMGVATYAIGIALLAAHHGLADPLQFLVTAIGAIATLEGLSLLAVPRAMVAIGAPFFARPRAWAIVTAVLGLVFVVIGLLGRAP